MTVVNLAHVLRLAEKYVALDTFTLTAHETLVNGSVNDAIDGDTDTGIRIFGDNPVLEIDMQQTRAVYKVIVHLVGTSLTNTNLFARLDEETLQEQNKIGQVRTACASKSCARHSFAISKSVWELLNALKFNFLWLQSVPDKPSIGHSPCPTPPEESLADFVSPIRVVFMRLTNCSSIKAIIGKDTHRRCLQRRGQNHDLPA